MASTYFSPFTCKLVRQKNVRNHLYSKWLDYFYPGT